MKDRETAYEQNMSGLEIAWRGRIAARATEGYDREMRRTSATTDEGIDAAKQAVEDMLFGSERWENVDAVDISDIALEAANREADSRR